MSPELSLVLLAALTVVSAAVWVLGVVERKVLPLFVPDHWVGAK